MEGQIFAENDPSKGITTSYFVVKFGNKNVKMKIEDQHTNIHIILDRKNQMGYKLLLLLNQTNYDLWERTIIYDKIIIDIEKNFIRYFEDYYDFSNLFREPLNQMYQQVLNFSGEFFNELIELIKIVHNNYTLIYNNIHENKYEFVNAIRKITKEEYIKYIYEMIEILYNFENSTLLFLKGIENELDNINDFQIDVLYDIIDQIYEAKLIFKQFNKNLFKSIEKGILTFKYEIRDYIEEFIGDLLYITDFLSINLNKNEILIKAIEENTRNIATKKLKDFRNIILSIMDLLVSNINDDYDNEMNLSNEQGIKYHSNKLAIKFLMNIEDQSNEVIENIKSRINNFYIYQSYSENIDELNNINNKTIIEYINDIYDNIILNSLELKPDFLNENSYINKNKDKLFQISKNFVSEINKEINEINIYIHNFTLDYIEKNIYIMYYNLYYFRKSFLDEEMKKLLNEFYLLLDRIINIHFKEIMNYNYNLLLKVLKEENALFNKYGFRDRRMLCSGFIQRFEQYKANFEKYLLLTYSEEFLNLLEKYFYKLRDDILNYIKNQLLSIKEYYFNNNLYKKDFYFIEQINNEIIKIIDNINNYYNEMNLNGDIKLKALDLSQKILEPFHKNAINYFDDYYNYLYGRTTNYHIKSCSEDFVSSNVKFLFSCFGYKNYYRYTSHYNNINLVIINLKKTDNYILNEINIIKNNFVGKFNIYLNNYVSFCQKLYNNLYVYANNKINTSTMKNLTKNYLNNFNEFVINISSNDDHFETMFNKKNVSINGFNNYINILKNNLDLLNERYYNLYYLPNYDKFVEYPEEIIFKINQYLNELTNNLDFTKNLVNCIYQKRLYNIKNTRIAYISNFLKMHFNYMKANINSSYIFEEYYLPVYNELNITFTSCMENLKSLFKEKTNNSIDNILFLIYDNYDEKIIEILNSTKNFSTYLKRIINETFFIINCEDYLTENSNIEENNNRLDNFTLEELCPKEKKKFDETYSKYNYNVVKLRTSIFYTKSLVEIIYSLFDNLDFKNIINIDKINKYDELLNDKNILNIYNESNYNLLRMRKESLSLLDELFQNFIDDFQSKYNYENDYLPFIEKLKEIIIFKNQDYNNNIIYKNKDTINYIYKLLEEFNETLFDQLQIKKNYDYFNLNKTYFIIMFNNYKSSIKNIFSNYNDTIKTLNNNYIFHNSIKKLLRKYQRNKREYFKEVINEFEKKFDFKLLNINYDLGDKLKFFKI